MIKKILLAILLLPTLLYAQINTERVMTIARNALYFEDYVLSIQYFNQVINAKPYLYEPYFFRGLAKINLDDYQGAESDCDAAIQRNPFVVGAYQIRGHVSVRTSLTRRLKIIKLPSNTTRRMWCFGIIFPFAIFRKKIMRRLRKIWVRF